MSLSLLPIPLWLPAAAGLVALAIPRRVPWVREILATLAAAATFAAALAIKAYCAAYRLSGDPAHLAQRRGEWRQ